MLRSDVDESALTPVDHRPSALTRAVQLHDIEDARLAA
jgi:hypothetical protein